MNKGWVKVCVCNSCPEVQRSCVFRQNRQGQQQSGCLGAASSVRLEETSTLTSYPCFTCPADTGRTSLLICKHAPPWSRPKTFGRKPPLASIQEIGIEGKKYCPARKKEACMRPHFYPLDAVGAEVGGNKSDGARSSLHSLLVLIFLQVAQFQSWLYISTCSISSTSRLPCYVFCICLLT